MKAWHFVGDTLRDGRPVPPDGKTLVHDGPLVLCKVGLHASVRLIDALHYAPGSTICRVQCSGRIIRGDDKLVCSERTILWRVDAEDLLRDFARRCALDVIHLWDAPDVVVRYLRTGDEGLRAAARAARDAAWASSRDPARTARDAAWAAARDAAAWAEVWESTLAARDAAWAAARDAAAWAEVWESTLAAAWGRQSRRLTAMVAAKRSFPYFIQSQNE